MFDVLRMTTEMKHIALNGVLVDRCRNQHVVQVIAEVGHSTVECFQGCLAGLFRWLSEVHLDFIFKRRQQVQPSLLGILGSLYDAERCLQTECLAVIGCHFRRAIYNGDTQIEHSRIGKGLHDNLVTNAVRISVRDSHANLSFH